MASKKVWCHDQSIFPVTKFCSFLVFVLKKELNFDCVGIIAHILFLLSRKAVVTTFGGRHSSHRCVDGSLIDKTGVALFDGPFGIYFDKAWNMLISEFGSHTIRIIDPDTFNVKTVAGGIQGNENGEGLNARFWIPVQFTQFENGDYLVVDSYNNNYRTIHLDKETGEYHVGTLALDSEVSAPHDMICDHNGDIIAADTCNHRIIKLTKSSNYTHVEPISPSPDMVPIHLPGHLDGSSSVTKWNKPAGIVEDWDHNLIICDYQNHCIRKITPDGHVSVIAGTPGIPGYKDGIGPNNTKFFHPNGMCLGQDKNYIICDTDNHVIRRIEPNGVVSTIAGDFGQGYLDGDQFEAKFNFPVNICMDSKGDFFVTDWKNSVLRKISFYFWNDGFSLLKDVEASELIRQQEDIDRVFADLELEALELLG